MGENVKRVEIKERVWTEWGRRELERNEGKKSEKGMREGRENQENTLTVLQCVPYFMIGVKHNEEITKAQINKKIQY